MTENLTIQDILRLADEIEVRLEKLHRRVTCCVMFVDLVSSTEFKAKHPDEIVWLRRLAVFLGTVSKIASQRGRVVKLIGDEVMAVFDGPSGVTSAEHAAADILEFCATATKFNFEVRIGMDFGEVSMMDFASGDGKVIISADPQGLLVDRAARLVGRCPRNVALCTEAMYRASHFPQRWARLGRFEAKGIPGVVSVFGFASGNGIRGVRLEEEAAMSLSECMKRLGEANARLSILKEMRE